MVLALSYLRELRDWWLQSLGPLLVSLVSLIALRCGLLEKLHKHIVPWLTMLLQESTDLKPFKQSYISAAQSPLETFWMISFACNLLSVIVVPILPGKVQPLVSSYTSLISSLAGKLCLGWFFYLLVNVKIARSSRGIAKKGDIMGAETSRQESQVAAVGQTARVLVLLVTFLSCLPQFQIDIGTILSFCGLGGLAISLLSKGVLVNQIGCLTIYLTQPFTLGDWIQTIDGEVDGWVQSITLYHTVVMRWDRRPLYIPNSKLMQVQIVNCSRMTNRRILFDIPVRVLDLDKVGPVLEDIRDLINSHKGLDQEQHRLVRLRQIGGYCAMIWVSCYSRSIALAEYCMLREDILLSIKNIMFKNGTSIASSLERISVDSGTKEVAPESSLLGPELQRAPPLELSQKAQLATELQRLKQQQETLWERERDLKDTESSMERELRQIEVDRARLEQRQRLAQTQESQLRDKVTSALHQDNVLKSEEEELEVAMEKVKVQEEALLHLWKEVQSDHEPPDQPTEEDLRRVKELQQQQALEERTAQAESFVELQQQLILQERKVVEQKQMALRAQGAQTPPPTQTEVTEGVPEKESVTEQEAREEAARYRQIAESLGGE